MADERCYDDGEHEAELAEADYDWEMDQRMEERRDDERNGYG